MPAATATLGHGRPSLTDLKALASFGVSAPGLDEAWGDYRRATVHGFLGWLCNPDVWQPAEVNTATYARFGVAMIDHETYDALGV